MTEKIYLETFEKCPGSLCFPLLWILFKVKIEFFIRKLENQRDWEQKKVCLIDMKARFCYRCGREFYRIESFCPSCGSGRRSILVSNPHGHKDAEELIK